VTKLPGCILAINRATQPGHSGTGTSNIVSLSTHQASSPLHPCLIDFRCIIDPVRECSAHMCVVIMPSRAVEQAEATVTKSHRHRHWRIVHTRLHDNARLLMSLDCKLAVVRFPSHTVTVNSGCRQMPRCCPADLPRYEYFVPSITVPWTTDKNNCRISETLPRITDSTAYQHGAHSVQSTRTECPDQSRDPSVGKPS